MHVALYTENITCHVFFAKYVLGHWHDKPRNNGFVLVYGKTCRLKICNLLWNANSKNSGAAAECINKPIHVPSNTSLAPEDILTSWHKLLPPDNFTQFHHLPTRSQYTPLPLGRCAAHSSAMKMTYTAHPGSLLASFVVFLSIMV